jgi:cytochrome P450
VNRQEARSTPAPGVMGFRPWDLSFIGNPYPAYAELRERAPVAYDEATDHWLVSRYHDVNALLRDRRVGRSYLHTATHDEMGRPPDPEFLAPFWHLIRSGILDMEPPNHPRVRGLVSKAFTPRMVEGLRGRIQAIVDRLVEQGERLTEDELIGTCVLLLNAGHEATVNVTGNGWWSLFRNPSELARLRADHTLVPAAVEELMRYDTPLQMFERWVLEDMTWGGVDLPQGTELALLFGSANHDPTVFRDPGRLDLARADNPQLSFGAGIHFCLGAPLARLELEISFGTLLRRAPALALNTEPEWKPGYIIRGLKELSVSV